MNPSCIIRVALSFLLVSALLVPQVTEAARLWSSGFESQSTTDGVEWDYAWAPAPPISTSIKRSGNASLNCSAGSHGGVGKDVTASTISSTYFRYYLYVDTAPIPGQFMEVALFTQNGADLFGMYINGDDNNLILWDDNSDTAVGGTAETAALTTGTWHRVEVFYDSAAGSVEAKLDGVTFESVGSGYGGWSLDTMELFCGSAATGSVYFDDIAINDGTGSYQNSWPGEGHIVHLYPNAAGDNNTWLKSDGSAGDANNYQSVDEVTPDDATTYLKRTTTTIKIDDYNVTDTSTAGIGAYDTISLVSVGTRGKATSNTSSTGRRIYLRNMKTSGGTVSKSAFLDYSTTVWESHWDLDPKLYKLTNYVDPDGAAWTSSTIDSMQIGMETYNSSTTELDISSIWALVEYVTGTAPSAPVGAARFLNIGTLLLNGGTWTIR